MSFSSPVSNAWLALFERIGLPREGCVVEIGPGRRSKIAPALARYEFRGRLYLLDGSRVACSQAAGFCRRTLPGARVVPVPARVRRAGSRMPRRIDLLAGNHVLDDWALAATLSPDEYARVFDRMDSSSIPAVAALWERARSEGRIADSMATVRAELRPLLGGARVLALNHYRSWVHERFGLSVPHQVGTRCLISLRRELLVTRRPAPLRLPGGRDSQWCVATGMGSL